MKEDLLPIGKMAALNRVTVSTLRLYDEKGLLKPRYMTRKQVTAITISTKMPAWT